MKLILRGNPPGARRLQPEPDQFARREAQDEQLQSAAPQAPAHRRIDVAKRIRIVK